MKRAAFALAILLAAPVSAQASVHTIAPPGNSGVGQYLETLPTAGGNQPTNTVHPNAGGVGGGAGGGQSGGPPTTGGALGAGGSDGSGVTIAPATRRALAAQGPTGAAAAALAQATAPRTAHPSPAVGRDGAASPSDGSSPAASVFKALTGSTSGGGLGPLLPIALIGSLLAGGVLALVRRRRTD